MKKKTKILAIGDIHGDTGLVKKLASRAKKENIDLVIFAGDLTFAEMSTKNLIGPFTKINKPVLIMPGNHESPELIDFLAQAYPNAESIHGYSFKKNDVGIFGAGGADIGIHTLKEKDIFKLLEKSHNQIKDSKKKVMVTHMHPHKGKAEKLFGWKGSTAVRKALRKFKPDILISAHIHEAAGIEEELDNVKIVNVCRKEKVFEI